MQLINDFPLNWKALDLKNGNGAIYAGPSKTKPDCTITMDEKDSMGMFDGTLDPAKVNT